VSRHIGSHWLKYYTLLALYGCCVLMLYQACSVLLSSCIDLAVDVCTSWTSSLPRAAATRSPTSMTSSAHSLRGFEGGRYFFAGLHHCRANDQPSRSILSSQAVRSMHGMSLLLFQPTVHWSFQWLTNRLLLWNPSIHEPARLVLVCQRPAINGFRSLQLTYRI
jgi:hypothetical protein